MKIYHPEGASTTLMVAPGHFHPDVSDWNNEQGKPLRFDIRFENGVAVADKKLGDWLIENGYANRTGLKRVFHRILQPTG